MLKRARGAHLDLTCHNPKTLANVCESVSGDEWGSGTTAASLNCREMKKYT
jgi:hypothetical protein